MAVGSGICGVQFRLYFSLVPTLIRQLHVQEFGLEVPLHDPQLSGPQRPGLVCARLACVHVHKHVSCVYTCPWCVHLSHVLRHLLLHIKTHMEKGDKPPGRSEGDEESPTPPQLPALTCWQGLTVLCSCPGSHLKGLGWAGLEERGERGREVRQNLNGPGFNSNKWTLFSGDNGALQLEPEIRGSHLLQGSA